MEKNNNNTIKIAITAVMFLSAIGVYFAFDVSKINTAKDKDLQIEQMGRNISSKKSYYEGVNNQVKLLEEAGWAEKKKSIEVNFSSGPFYIPKMRYFLQTMASANGVTLGTVTYSSAMSLKPQASQEESTTKNSKSTKSSTPDVKTTTTYVDQLKGSVKTTTFNLSITGTYDSLKNFLKALEEQTRIGTVQSITFSDAKVQGVVVKGKSIATNIITIAVVVDFYSY
jgi:hypothetical protein